MTNTYLQGNFAPVTEEVTLTDLAVSGTIPDHLDGRYIRNGPNPLRAPDPATYHWFIGDGMVHGIALRDGRAQWYRNRWVRTGPIARALGETPPEGPVHAGMELGPNTNVIFHAGQTLAVVEGGVLPSVLGEALDTVGSCDFDGTLTGGFSAHPHRDPATGELHTLAYYWGWGNKVAYTVLDTAGRVRRAVDIATTASPMMHDFALTDAHVVCFDLPVAFDLDLVAQGAPFPYGWSDELPARIGLVARDAAPGTDGFVPVQWFDLDPCYVFHPMNAYEDGTRTIVDVVVHPATFRTDRHGPNEGPSILERWTLDRRAGTVARTVLHDRSQEFPRIDERRTGSPHRIGYSAGFSMTDQGLADSAVLRHDLVAGTDTARSFGAGTGVGEFVFVANGPDAAEDDGLLMGLVHHHADARSQLRLLDAATLEDVAIVEIPVRVPYGFHGNWIPTA